ncbi:MAG: DUF4381 domain-containing protein [Rhodanobacter sp.]
MLQVSAAPPLGQTGGPQLRDIHLPPAPAWWPPAYGWWLSAVLIMSLLIAAAWAWRYAMRRYRDRRTVLREVEDSRLRHARDADDANLAAALHQLLRRVARTHDPAAGRQQGDAWSATLQRVPVDAETLQHLLGLEQAMYRADPSFDSARAVSAVRTWLQLALQPRKWKRAVNTHA